MFNKRMVYMAPPVEGPQSNVEEVGEGAAGAKKKLEGFMPKPEELESGAGNKAKTAKPEVKEGKIGVETEKKPISKNEVKELSKGHPEVAIDNSNKNIVAKMKAEFVAENKKAGRGGAEMLHRDFHVWAENNKPPEYVLIYDELHNPPERLFKEKMEDPVDSEVKATFQPGTVTELSAKDKMVATVKEGAAPLPTKDGDSWLSDSMGGYKYLLIRDNRKTDDPFRIFKGKAV